MQPIILSVIACFGWGIADFIGGYKSRELNVLSILAISNLSGLLLISIMILYKGQPLPGDLYLIWAVLAGPIGITAMVLLYRSLAVGVISILAPISATGVILPVLWGLYRGDTMSGVSMLGIFMAVLGCLLAVMETRPGRNKKKLTRGVGMALGAAVLVGLYFIFMDHASTHHPVWAAFILKATTTFCLEPVVIISRSSMAVGRPQFLILLFMGLADAAAALSFALAASGGMLSQVAVISSLYPAVTVILSACIVKERITRFQAAGVVLAIAGVAMISAF